MPLDIADREREILEGNHLKIVVAQLKFPPIHAFNTAEGVAPFQERVRDRYPISEDRARQVVIRVAPGGVDAAGDQLGPWRFLTADGQWIVSLAADAMSLEAVGYRAYEDFRQRMVELLDIAGRVIRPARVDRFGFRFVNEISFPGVAHPSDWRGLVSADLLGPLAEGDLADRAILALQQVTLQLDGGKLVLKHGFSPGDEPGTSRYLIDIDAMDEEPTEFAPAAVVEKMDLFNRWAWNLFRANIENEMVARMRAAQ